MPRSKKNSKPQILAASQEVVCIESYREKKRRQQSEKIFETKVAYKTEDDTEGMKVLRENIKKSELRRKRLGL